jgi:hypothetical protein
MGCLSVTSHKNSPILASQEQVAHKGLIVCMYSYRWRSITVRVSPGGWGAARDTHPIQPTSTHPFITGTTGMQRVNYVHVTRQVVEYHCQGVSWWVGTGHMGCEGQAAHTFNIHPSFHHRNHWHSGC